MKKLVPEYSFSEEQLNKIALLAKETGLTEQITRILYARGVDTAQKINRFMHPSEKNFLSPFLMKGMKEAVELITRARDEGWVVAVFGDYDADGICASAIMYHALQDFGIEAHVYVPERVDGYGLSIEAIDRIFEECNPELFITVDCGISCAKEAQYIYELGSDVIVTDHHELPEVLPDCIVINPKLEDDYPSVTMSRFSPKSGTLSATVAKVAKSRYLYAASPRRAQATLKATPAPQRLS